MSTVKSSELTSFESAKDTDTQINWVSVIFYPNKIASSMSELDNNFTGGRNPNRPRMVQDFQILREIKKRDKDNNELIIPEVFSYSFHPGTNLGHHILTVNDSLTINRILLSDIELIRQNPNNEFLFESGAFELIYPESDDGSEIGYRLFNNKNALKLIRNHFHVTWIDRALLGERRANILTEAQKRKNWLLAEEKKRQEQ